MPYRENTGIRIVELHLEPVLFKKKLKSDANQFNTNHAKVEIIHNNDKIPLSDRAMKIRTRMEK